MNTIKMLLYPDSESAGEMYLSDLLELFHSVRTLFNKRITQFPELDSDMIMSCAPYIASSKAQTHCFPVLVFSLGRQPEGHDTASTANAAAILLDCISDVFEHR